MTSTTTEDSIKPSTTKLLQNMLQVIYFRKEDNRSLSRDPEHGIDFCKIKPDNGFKVNFLKKLKNELGVIPLLVLLAGLGFVIFILAVTSLPLRNQQGNRSGEATYRTVAAAEEAMWMLRQFESQMKAFPQTRKVLWGSIIEGWLADPIGLIQEKEKDFARFLAGAEEDDCLEFLLGRIRQGLDSINNVLARKKVVQFLHYRAAEDNDRVVSAVSKTLGRYMTLDQLVFVSHVLERIEGNGQTPLALQLTAPVVAKQAERAMQTSATLSDLCREI